MKKNIIKKITVLLYLTFSLVILMTPTNFIFAQPAPTGYQLLAPLPCPPNTPGCTSKEFTNFDPASDKDGKNPRLGEYLNLMIKIIIGIAAVLAVVMVVMGGIEYMTSELISSKEAGRERMTHAVLGLLVALGAYALLNTINPDLLSTNIRIPGVTVEVTLDEQLKAYSGQGKCEPVADPSSPCSPANLAAAGFPNGTQASSICNGESKGVPSLGSGVDRCSNGVDSFSFGLFQINVIAHANAIPGGVCSGVFQVNGGGTQGACLESRGNVCIRRDCSVINQAKYQTCKDYITNPVNNIAFAKNLQIARDWNQWGAYNSCKGTFPPK